MIKKEHAPGGRLLLKALSEESRVRLTEILPEARGAWSKDVDRNRWHTVRPKVDEWNEKQAMQA